MPSVSKKQQRFMGSELGKKRSGKPTQTNMSSKQLGEFASSVGSLEDIDLMEDNAQREVVCDEFVHPSHRASSGPIRWGALDPPELDSSGAGQFSKGKQSCNRDAGQGNHYGAPVEYFGPDTDYRAEEINPQDYGRDYDPFPFRDMFKDQKKDTRPNLRLLEENEYADMRTPGTINNKAFKDSMAHGAISYEKVPSEQDDNRGFEAQQKFRRNNAAPDEDTPKVSGRDTKYGRDIR